MREANILVLESESVVCWDIEDCLDRAGYQVSAAITGEEALDQALRSPPDIALVDTGLRGVRTFAQVATELQGRHGTLIVLLTTCRVEDAHVRFDAVKPVAFIEKPFVEHTLLSVIERTAVIRDVISKAHELRLPFHILTGAAQPVAA